MHLIAFTKLQTHREDNILSTTLSPISIPPPIVHRKMILKRYVNKLCKNYSGKIRRVEKEKCVILGLSVFKTDKKPKQLVNRQGERNQQKIWKDVPSHEHKERMAN